jgi:Kef-type K+ transport system membrane component KefB
VIDDVLGLVVLGVVTAMAAVTASGGSESAFATICMTLAKVVGFGVGVVILRPLTVWSVHTAGLRLGERGELVAAFVWVLGLGAAATAAGLSLVIGAFLAGVILAGTRDRATLERTTAPIVAIFATLFFVAIGTRLDVRQLVSGGDSDLLLFVGGAVLLSLAAIGGTRIAGIGLSSRGYAPAVIGWGMVPRGEIMIVFAQIGADVGYVDHSLLAMLIVVIIASSVVGPVMLRRAIQAVPVPTDEERARHLEEDDAKHQRWHARRIARSGPGFPDGKP